MKIRTRAIVLAAAVVMAGASLASQASADQTTWRVDCPQAAIFPVFVTNPQDLGVIIGICVKTFSGTPTVTVLR